MKMMVIVIGLVLLSGLIVVSVIVEIEGDYTLQVLGGAGKVRALILFHPSRDAHFSDDLSIALADGLKVAGFAMERATLTSKTPAEPKGYALIGVVSNTFYSTPDLPTLRYLEKQIWGHPLKGTCQEKKVFLP